MTVWVLTVWVQTVTGQDHDRRSSIAILAIVRWVLPTLKPHAKLLFAQVRHKVVTIMRDMLALLLAKVKQTIPRMILLPGLVYTVGRRLTALSTNLSAQEAATNMIQETLDAGAMLCLSKSSMSLSNDVSSWKARTRQFRVML